MIGLPSLRALDQAQATRIWLAVVLDGIDATKLKRVPRYERGTETNRDTKKKVAVQVTST